MTLMPVSRIGRLRVELVEARRLAVDRVARHVVAELLAVVDRGAEDVEDAPQRLLADRHGDRSAGVDDLRSARETVGRVHRHRAHAVVAQMLLHLGDEDAIADRGSRRPSR